MNKYKGKICPYCKTAFLEDDEIVICDICEMPHHKDCWIENRQCTTFGCTGNVKNLLPTNQGDSSVAYSPQLQSQQQQSFAFCIYCGNKHVVGDMFCGKCGKKISIKNSNN